MYDEDRARALRLYDDIFEETGNETAVLQMLVSPTRQAVNLARAYDGKERRYQADNEGTPAYLQVIEELRAQAATLNPPAPRYEPGQISLFHEQETEDSGENLFESFGFPDLPEQEETAVPAEDAATAIGSYPDEDKDTDAPTVVLPPQPKPTEPAPAPSAYTVDDFSDAVDDFLRDFSISDDALDGKDTQPAAETVKTATRGEYSWETPQPAQSRQDVKVVWDLPDEEPASAPAAQTQRMSAEAQTVIIAPVRETPVRRDSAPERPDLPPRTEQKASVGLVILYILLAVPVGLLCAMLLVAAGALALSLAAGTLGAGFSGLISAFSFSVFSDLLLVFGLSLACAAIGLLLFWLFIWLLFGAIPGLVRGLCALARKLCYKEVAV